MNKGASIALNSRDHRYRENIAICRNSGLVWKDIPSKTPREESQPLSLTEACFGSSMVQRDNLRNHLQKVSLEGKLLENFQP